MTEWLLSDDRLPFGADKIRTPSDLCRPSQTEKAGEKRHPLRGRLRRYGYCGSFGVALTGLGRKPAGTAARCDAVHCCLGAIEAEVEQARRVPGEFANGFAAEAPENRGLVWATVYSPRSTASRMPMPFAFASKMNSPERIIFSYSANSLVCAPN